jgi:hypothetical protein
MGVNAALPLHVFSQACWNSIDFPAHIIIMIKHPAMKAAVMIPSIV